jgi:hypothetical protein
MDDFRVGSVPSADSYGRRQPSGAVTRKREKHRDDQQGGQDDTEDTFDPLNAQDERAGDDPADAATDVIEDYYVPSDPDPNTE